MHVIGNKELDYELLSVGLQCLWICGAWCLLTSLGVPRRHHLRSLIFLVFSGFLFYNSVYTWPKLLAAACMLFIFSIVIDVIRNRNPITYFQTVLAAMCLGLSLMAHPGSAFSLAALALIFFSRFRGLFPYRRLLIGLLVLMAYVLPWTAYQKFVDPPGNRLIKMHIAGEYDIDSRSAWRGIRDAYKDHTVIQIIRFKLSNIALLIGRKPLDTFGIADWSLLSGLHVDRHSAENSRIAQREWIWNAVGLLNVGWLAGLFIVSRRRKEQLAIPLSGWLIAAALINLAFWSLITFGPNETVTTHSSYADIILLSVGLLGFLLTTSQLVYFSLLALQIFNFFVIWVWSPSSSSGSASDVIASSLQFPFLLVGGLVTVAMIWFATGNANRGSATGERPGLSAAT